MEHYAVNIGTREEIAAELGQYGYDRAAHGKEDKARVIARALHQITDGDADVVQVGRAIYVVAGSYVARALRAERDTDTVDAGHVATRVTNSPRSE